MIVTKSPAYKLTKVAEASAYPWLVHNWRCFQLDDTRVNVRILQRLDSVYLIDQDGDTITVVNLTYCSWKLAVRIIDTALTYFQEKNK